MKVYITACQAISPQNTFLNNGIPDTVIKYSEPLKNVPVNYKEYFSPLQSRRINKLIKNSHICAIEAVKQAGIEKPDVIITGSGLGCVESTEKFLNDMLQTDEGLLAPTAFIQSTSNAIGAQIALHYNCKGYNVLYAQKSFSFEIALQDAFLRLKDNEEQNILLGGFDEITTENFQLKQEIGIFKNGEYSNTDILKADSSGSIAGEGSTFFVLTNKKSKALAEVSSVHMHALELNKEKAINWIAECLSKECLSLDSIDLVVVGFNGDKNSNKFYNELITNSFPNATLAYYKHLCGEYDTSTAFGTWFAANAISANKIPKHSLLSGKNKTFKNVLIYNQQNSRYHSITLLKSIIEK